MGCFSASLFVINSFVSVSVSDSAFFSAVCNYILHKHVFNCCFLINCIGVCLIIFRISAVLVMIDFHNGIGLFVFFLID